MSWTIRPLSAALNCMASATMTNGYFALRRHCDAASPEGPVPGYLAVMVRSTGFSHVWHPALSILMLVAAPCTWEAAVSGGAVARQRVCCRLDQAGGMGCR